MRSVCSILMLFLVLTVLGALTVAQAQRFSSESSGKYHTEEFDSQKPLWEVKFANERHRRPQRLKHESDRTERISGNASERIQLSATGNNQMARLELPLPAARVIDELHLKMWVRSNRRGPILALRIVFPNQVDPDTGNRLRTIIRGDEYKRVGEWQLMHCRTTDKLLESGVRRLRNQLRTSTIDVSGAYADKALMLCELANGVSDIRTDKLEFGPIVPTIPFKDEDREPEVDIPVAFRLGRIFVEDRPFFPRIIPHHGEDIQQLKEAGFNLVWVPDTEDTQVLHELKTHGMWAMGTPSLNPRSIFHRGSSSATSEKLPDLTKLDSILCWYLGTQIGREDHDKLVELTKATRAADRGVARPFAADVLDNDRVYSRPVDMLSSSRHMIGSNFSFRQFRDLMIAKRRQVLPGTFLWTWIHTEPVPAQVEWREQLGRNPMVIEPEQIRSQVYSALASGCRAIGFWKRGLLMTSNPGADERLLQIAQLNLELDLLGDLLSAGQVDAQYRVEIIDPDAPSQRSPISQVSSRRNNSSDQMRQLLVSGEAPRVYSKEIEAAAIRSNDGLLLLPVWYGKDSQFVPDGMTAPAIRVKVPGGFESAQPYLVTTTGVRSLARNRPSGGLEITLPEFDQTAAIIITTKQEVVERLRQHARRLAPASAKLQLQLAITKLARVRKVDSELRSLGCNPAQTETLLQDAEQQIKFAESLLTSTNYTPSVTASRSAMTLLRRLQRAHWEHSLNGRSPMISPYTACFQTLPDHWRMSQDLGKVLAKTGTISPKENLLPLGNFERRGFNFTPEGGWKHEQNEHPRIQANAESWSGGVEGQFCLALVAIAKTKEDPPESFARSPVIVSSPSIPVTRGQVLRVSGKVRVQHEIQGSLDGAMVYDGLIGKAGALRWKQTRGWEEFTFLREIPDDGLYSIRFVLDGRGTFEVDDVRVEPITRGSSSGVNLQVLPNALQPQGYVPATVGADPSGVFLDDPATSRPAVVFPDVVVPVNQRAKSLFGSRTLGERLRRASRSRSN